ncbi:MAG: CHRD domain-containing protein, partial [Methyloceanibacter sp.]
QQVPPIQIPGTGTADLTYDPSTRVLTWTITYGGLSGPVTMAHVHGPAAEGKNGPVVIWISKQGSSAASPISGQATLTPEQAQQFAAGEWYINVHTKAHPAGEIRGQVIPPKS